jgi:hypothetical protein
MILPTVTGEPETYTSSVQHPVHAIEVQVLYDYSLDAQISAFELLCGGSLILQYVLGVPVIKMLAVAEPAQNADAFHRMLNSMAELSLDERFVPTAVLSGLQSLPSHHTDLLGRITEQIGSALKFSRAVGFPERSQRSLSGPSVHLVVDVGSEVSGRAGPVLADPDPGPAGAPAPGTAASRSVLLSEVTDQLVLRWAPYGGPGGERVLAAPRQTGSGGPFPLPIMRRAQWVQGHNVQHELLFDAATGRQDPTRLRGVSLRPLDQLQLTTAEERAGAIDLLVESFSLDTRI